MPFTIIRQDITKMETDAVVNAANTDLRMGSGVCGAIFQAAGAEQLQRECNLIGRCETGEAVITPGFNLPARYVIHTPGPIWQGGGENEAELLRSSYINSLKLAAEHGVESIAFPLISGGVYGYPKDEALHIAVTAIGDFLQEREMDIYLVIFDKEAYSIGEQRFSAIQSFIDERYVEEHELPHRAFPRQAAERARKARKPRAKLFSQESVEPPVPAAAAAEMDDAEPMELRLEDVIGRLDESFSRMLLRLIDEKGRTDVEIYKGANIDRKLFSKIRTAKGYNPSKPTAIALAIALKLNLDETKDLLGKAGYALSHSHKTDLIVEYFIETRNYNIFELNETLFAFDQPGLGGK